MEDKALREQYHNQFGPQIFNSEVPEDIIKTELIKYMEMDNEGTFMLVKAFYHDANGKLCAFHMGADPVPFYTEDPGDGPCNPNPPPFLKREFDYERSTTFEEESPDDAIGFYIPNGAPAQEIERRFWITVFNHVYDCQWQLLDNGTFFVTQ